jgi:hypothetical protein
MNGTLDRRRKAFGKDNCHPRHNQNPLSERRRSRRLEQEKQIEEGEGQECSV